MALRVALLSAGLAMALGVAAVGGLPFGDTPARALANCDTTEAALDSAEQEFIRLLNEERARNGVAALAAAESLNRAAAWKSADQAATGGLSHTDSRGRGPLERIRDCGNAAPYWGENVLVGMSSAQAAFDLWKTSSGHYQNMISPAYAFVGVGRHGTYWTLDFSSAGDGMSSPPPPAATAIPSPPATATLSPTPSPTPSPTATPSPTPGPATPARSVAVVPLSAGGNLVTYYGPLTTAANAFAGVAGSLVDAYRWDQAEGWQYWAPGLPPNIAGFASVGPGDVFYLVLRADGAWQYVVQE